MPRVSQMIPSNYLKASALLAGDGHEERDVTITSVAQEAMPGDGTEKWVVHFDEFDKGLVLNVTNTRQLGELCGDLSDDWIGRRVRLYVVPASFRGEEFPSIRIKSARPSQTQLADRTSARGGEPSAAQTEIPF